MRSDGNPREAPSEDLSGEQRPLSPDVPMPPQHDFDAGTGDVPEPPNREEVQSDDDVNPDAGSIEPPD